MYRVEKVLTNMNFIVRKTETNFTQCVHRIRLRPIIPQFEVPDLTEIDPANFRPDPVLAKLLAEPALFDHTLPELLYKDAEEALVKEEVQILHTPFLNIAFGPPAVVPREEAQPPPPNPEQNVNRNRPQVLPQEILNEEEQAREGVLPLPIQAEEIPNDNFEHLQNYNSDDDRPLRLRVADPERARDRNRVLGVEELPPPQAPTEVTPPQVRPKIPMTLHAQKKQRARRAAEHATFGFKAPDFSPETPPRNAVSVQLQDQDELVRIATPPPPKTDANPRTFYRN